MEENTKWIKKVIAHIAIIALSGLLIVAFLHPVIKHIQDQGQEAKQSNYKPTVIVNCASYSNRSEYNTTGKKAQPQMVYTPDNATIRALHSPSDIIWLLFVVVSSVFFYRSCRELAKKLCSKID